MDISKAVFDGFAAFLGGAAATVLFLMPGYIMGKAFAGGVRGPMPSDRAFLATTASGGLLTHLLVAWWTIPLFLGLTRGLPEIDAAHYLAVLAWVFVVLAVIPAFLGAAAARVADVESGPVYQLLNFLGFTTAKRTAEAWTWVFRQMARSGDPIWLRVRLKNKAGIYYGLFGGRSIVSSDPTVRDVYLQRTWPLDAHGQPLPDTDYVPNRGVWIAGDQIMTVEFVPNAKKEKGDEQRSRTTDQGWPRRS